MKPENKSFLDEHRGVYEMLIRAGEVKHLDGHTRERMRQVIHEEFAPNYLVNLWCGECIAEMIKYLYVQFDKYLKEQERIVAMTFPVHDPPSESPKDQPNELPNKPNHKRKNKR